MPSPLGTASSKSAPLWEWCSVGNLVLWPPISPQPIGEKEIFHICQAFHLHGYKKKKKNGPRVVRVAPEELHGDIVKKVTEYVKRVRRLL